METPAVAQQDERSAVLPGPPEAAVDDLHASSASPAEATAPDAAPAEAAGPEGAQHFDPVEALKLGSLRLANLIKREGGNRPHQQHQQQQHTPEAEADQGEGPVARFKATAAELGARAKQQGGRFYQVSVKAAAITAEAVKRLAAGEPVQALCRSELGLRPVPQLVLGCCNALVAGGGLTSERIFKHNPPQELVDRLAAAVAGQEVVSLVPPGASPHAVAALLKQFLLGLPEPLLTYRLLPQWVAAGEHPASCQLLLQQLPPANGNTLRLLMQTCHYVNEQSAQNEMDAQALAGVLVPCLAWNPAPKPQGPPPASLTKALSINNKQQAFAGGAAAAAEQQAEGTAAAAGGGEGAAGAGQQAAGDGAGQAAAAHADALSDSQQQALVVVVEFMITNFSAIFN